MIFVNSMSDLGLSPPTRGNLLQLVEDLLRLGSIPAHAGEPGLGGGKRQRLQVYPRPRGGTASAASSSRARSGLSPPTRGNQAGRMNEDGT